MEEIGLKAVYGMTELCQELAHTEDSIKKLVTCRV